MTNIKYETIDNNPRRSKTHAQNTEESKEPPEPTITEDEILQKVLEESLIDTRTGVDLSFVSSVLNAKLTLIGLNKETDQILNSAPFSQHE